MLLSNGRWECFLLQLINSSQAERGTSFSSSMMRTFQRGLLSSRDGEAPKLTENGFQFLLMETNAQLWYIMREYISSAKERGVDPTELISFLLELSFHTLGEAYSLNTLTDVQRIAVRDLAELGLVKSQQGRKDSWFIPTKLATNLSASLSDSSSSKEGFVVVETNFRMYAYSTSRLHCDILRLFSRVEYQLPNLVVGAITKESLYFAFENGITAEQIISFLQQNAHPCVADKIPVVPENVADQIRLWETDRNRVDIVPSHLYEDFPNKPSSSSATSPPAPIDAMAGKKRKSASDKQPKHRLPLGAEADAVADASKRRRSGATKQHQAEEEASVPSSISAKILREALKQQQEEILADSRDQRPSAAAAAQSASSSFPVPNADGEEEEDDIDEFDGFDAQSEYDGGVVDIDEEDEKALAAFVSKDTSSKRTLGDVILQKIREKDAGVSTEGRPPVKLDSSIIELYKGVGEFLSRYTSGKIPKAFKRIPSLECWADVLQLTEPENWSPNAVYQATRLFSSNMNAKNAVRFYEAILLPRVRNDIRQNKRLHFALYQSLKKSLYKPAAFFKGILLPLCQERNCTLREAVIIGSIIQKVTIPPLHASATLMKLAEMEYCGTTSYFIKLFLDKKYALPYRVLDAVFAHFMRFLDEERIMPVIWHQSLLAFVERYKNELEKKNKEKLSRLLDHQKHYLVTPEIRRELRSSSNRGEKETNMSISSPIYVITKPIEEDRWNVPEVPMEED